ncbi:hypothetical protein [Spiroplasma endosymbiont of Danaus chrysippus]|nr:hypothetical protein [Spiroplasma endosymbiont of Danaus chrysippus]
MSFLNDDGLFYLELMKLEESRKKMKSEYNEKKDLNITELKRLD